jgi:hypothetical protein
MAVGNVGKSGKYILGIEGGSVGCPWGGMGIHAMSWESFKIRQKGRKHMTVQYGDHKILYKLNELFLIALMMIVSFSELYVPLKAVVID